MNATAARSDLAKNPANHVPLSPVTFLERSATIWPNRIAVRHGRFQYTYREFELLCYLAALPRRPVSRAELMREVWHDRAPGGDVSVRTVDTHVRRLRAKLGPYARVLTTIRGRGYRFDPGPRVRYLAA